MRPTTPAAQATSGGRAQPGDVLGFETGGETTSLGDTPEDENKRRHETEKDVAEDIKNRRDDERD